MKGRNLIVGTVLAGAALAAGAGILHLAADTEGVQPAPKVAVITGEVFPVAAPQPVPELRFVDGAGSPRALSDFRGKAVLLNLWATWCVPCRKEMPDLDRLQGRLGGPDFEVVPLSVDRKGLPAIQAFYAEVGLKVLPIYLDDSGNAIRAVGALGLPTTLLIDAEGREIGRAAGAREWDSPTVLAEIVQRIGRAPGVGVTAVKP